MQLFHIIRKVIKDRYFQTESTDHFTSEEIHTLLRSERRRQIIHYLADTGEPTSVRELSHHLAEQTNTDRQTVYITLIQSHLPKLAEKDIVKYDHNRKVVRSTPLCESLQRIDQETQRYL